MKKASSIITSAETIGNNLDLLTQILLRLSTKNLLKLKCISKQWLSLISSPNFCLAHTRHHQTNGVLAPTALLLRWYNTFPSDFHVIPLKHNFRVPFFHFDYMDYAPNINVLQSCYGLFLCESVVDSPEDIISRHFVCNPTTKKFKELSFPKKPFQGSKFYVSMAFDPLKSPHYKIICVREVSDKPSKRELDIYSSETDSWSISRISFAVENSMKFEDPIFCNGKIHWNCYWNNLLYFDVENERLEPFPMPISTMEAAWERTYFGECRGVLYVAVTYFVYESLEFDVFEIASDYSHWILKHRLYIGDLYKYFPKMSVGYDDPSFPGFSDVCITQFEKDQETKVLVWVENKVVFYDYMDGTWKSLYDLRPSFDSDDLIEYCHYSFLLPYRSHHAYQYFENLSFI